MSRPIDPEVKREREFERLRISNARLTQELRNYRRRSGGFKIDESIEELQDFLAENQKHPLLSAPTRYKNPKAPAKPVFSKTHYEYAVKAWSDWHISETVEVEDSNGFNKYNSVIAANRVWEDTDKTKRILTAHSALYPLKKLVILILGDMINGSIHEELKLTNDLLDVPASVLASKLICMGIEELKTLGLPIEVPCVIGNHPRLTAKMPTKKQAHLSMDYLIYEMVANYFRNDDQVNIIVHTGQILPYDVLGHRYILEHGIGVPHGGEENFESHLRALYDDPLFRNATGLTGPAFDMVVIGNMHRPKFLERTVVNGSLVGQNELGVSWRLKPIRAQQMLWGVTEDLPRTWMYAIDTTANRNEGSDNPFGEYTNWYMKRHRR